MMTAETQRKLLPRIVLTGSNEALLQFVHRILAERFDVSLITEPSEAEQIPRLPSSSGIDLLLLDWHGGNNHGNGREDSLSLLIRFRAMNPWIPVILLARMVDVKDVARAARLGISDVIIKPFRKSDIDQAVEQCLCNPEAVPTTSAGDQIREIPLDDDTSFVLSCKRMHELEAQCRLVARTDIPVLILGESGTGKEVATLFIHKMSARSHRGFLKVNCAAMPADLLESELFGYEQGAFTGAVKSKPGIFELCNGGTIFLDEIGEMPSPLQAKLLQVLQDGTFARLGGRVTVRVDVRVIAATNVDIKEAIAQKKFREDLYYRLNGFTLRMPPLRERVEEIPIFAHHFMRKVAMKYDGTPLQISPKFMQSLHTHTWPGNLRELENVIKRYFILGDEQAVIHDLKPMQPVPLAAPVEEGIAPPGLKRLVKSAKGDAESVAIAQALEGAGWNRKLAARQLQISYKALLYKIKQYNLNPAEKQHRASV